MDQIKIIYIGDSKSITKNLLELGAQVLPYSNVSGLLITPDINGMIVTADLPELLIENLKKFGLPIVLSSGKVELQKNIDVLVLDEDEMNIFCGTNKWDIPKCREKIGRLGIKHLVVSLSKKEIQQQIARFRLPELAIKEIQITDKEIEKAKDVITAIIGYIYIKEGLLLPESLKRAKVGAVLDLIEFRKAEGYHLRFNLKK